MSKSRKTKIKIYEYEFGMHFTSGKIVFIVAYCRYFEKRKNLSKSFTSKVLRCFFGRKIREKGVQNMGFRVIL